MLKINSTQVVSKELRKVRHFSSIITKKLKSESISSENINSFTFEELTDINKILSLTDFILTKYEHKKSMRLILNEFVDLITKSANSLESIDDDVEEMLISSTAEISRLKSIQHNFSKKNDFVFNENKLIGAGRALADGLDCSYICDIAIHPDFQGVGLGKEIINKLKEFSCEHKKIILYANPGKEGFYKKLGFKRMNTAMAIFENQDLALENGLLNDK